MMEKEQQQAEQVCTTPAPPGGPIQLKTSQNLRALAGALLQRHGCLVEPGRLTLPPGSTRTPYQPSWPSKTRWYDIVLPDQYQLLEAYAPRRDSSILFWLPEELEAKRSQP
ncbi:MAG TPA: hypothetical protein VFB60_24665 [Ktedonobacteraceae bacterium]|nr:hypothetical protein [Ktedonobacteraceae bacterium]